MKTNLTVFILFILSGFNNIFGQSYSEILARPTDNSVSVSILFNQNMDMYIEYGTQSGVYTNQSTTITNVANTPYIIEIQGLSANTKYFYRTRYRTSGGGTFSTGTEHSFMTQRAAGSTYTFTVESDVHLYDKKGCANLYKVCLKNQALDDPDFMIDMGDTYGDDHFPFTITSAQCDSLHKVYRPLLGAICHSVPYYFCLGNHEGEMDYYMLQTPPNNLAIWSTLWRKFYFPNPEPNSFYSGNTEVEGYGMGNPQNYYAWTWGNALFVVIDAYRYQNDTTAKPKNWDWSIGITQYNWLKNTLEGSSAQYKFVFCHQVRGQGRGGALISKYFEWGGYENNGATYGFTTKRPGWAKPIHQLFVDNGVNIFFHGHDHLFSKEVQDGVIYQEVPMPSDSTYEIGMLANSAAYAGDTIDGSGHIRVMVSPECVKVDYVKAYLPIDTAGGIHHNRELGFSYTIGNCSSSVKEEKKIQNIMTAFPNPARDIISVSVPQGVSELKIKMINAFGQVVLETDSDNINVKEIAAGVYLLDIEADGVHSSSKIVINH